MSCATIRNCEIVTYHNHRGTRISVGISSHDGIKYVTACFSDPLLGCQHITARQASALILIERLSRAIRISDDE